MEWKSWEKPGTETTERRSRTEMPGWHSTRGSTDRRPTTGGASGEKGSEEGGAGSRRATVPEMKPK